MSGHRIARQRAARVFLAPALIAFATVAGLLAGLVGEGAWDSLATVCLLLPLAWVGRLLAPAGRPRGALPAPTRAAKSAPHPRGPAPPRAERA